MALNISSDRWQFDFASIATILSRTFIGAFAAVFLIPY
jgi:hypothetical protein